MKLLKIPFILLVLLILFSCGNKQESSIYESSIPITDIRKVGSSQSDLQSHQPGEVQIFREIKGFEGYGVVYYHDVSGALRAYRAFQGSNQDFDRANYEWTSDTSLAITLLNTSTQKQLSFRVFGNGNRSGMSAAE
ncbi:MAG: hypothetical protein R8P61_36570 [Bacteroidia bacterium]|nr:hypothetical protein [Bacteroidia bacterium]